MRNLKLVLQYDGTQYHGWQVQPDRRTVCGVLREIVERVLNERPAVYASSRTDSGAHALSQVVNFKTRSGIPAGNLKAALNGLLPEDIRVAGAEDVPEDFHACYSALSRRYRYTVRNSSEHSPFDRLYSWHFPFTLDLKAMAQAAAHVVGTHDFSAFKSARGEKQNRIRTVLLAEVRRKGEHVLMDVEADGFLTYMVRNIAGTLVDAGRGRITPCCVKSVLASKDRRRAGPTLPARGLCLVDVRYPRSA